MIDFVQRWQGLDFMGAVKYLAETLHLDLAELGFDSASTHEKWNTENKPTCSMMRQSILQHSYGAKQVRRRGKYLLGRGFTEKTLREAGWGILQIGSRLACTFTKGECRPGYREETWRDPCRRLGLHCQWRCAKASRRIHHPSSYLEWQDHVFLGTCLEAKRPQ